MWRRAFRRLFSVPARVDVADEVGEAVEMIEGSSAPAKVQNEDKSGPASHDCHQEIVVLSSVGGAAAIRAAAGDMPMYVVDIQPRNEPSSFVDSAEVFDGCFGHDDSAKVVVVPTGHVDLNEELSVLVGHVDSDEVVDVPTGHVDFDEELDGLAGHVDSTMADDEAMSHGDGCAEVGDVPYVDAATHTEDKFQELELSLADERPTGNLNSMVVTSGNGSTAGQGDTVNDLQGSKVQKTVKWAAELTDSVPVSWLRLRAEMERLEQEELEEDPISSRLLFGCIARIQLRSSHKKRSRTSGRWSKVM